jgi:prevent-host-death family protein
MPRQILAETCVSISELKKNPSAVVAQGEGFPVAVLNRNEPDFYCIPAAAWEEILDRIEDVELNAIADARQNQAVIKVELDDL